LARNLVSAEEELARLRAENESLHSSQKRIIDMSVKGTVNGSHLSVPEMQVSMMNKKIMGYLVYCNMLPQ